MTNMFKMIKDAAMMRKNVNKLQAQLRSKTVDYTGGDGLITVTARGDSTISAIRIDPKAIDPARPALLEKRLLAAVDGALEAARKMSAESMQEIMKDLGMPNIPGLS